MTKTARRCERGGWTWYVQTGVVSERIVVAGEDAEAVHLAAILSGYTVEGEPAVPVVCHCRTCEDSQASRLGDPCLSCDGNLSNWRPRK